MQIKIHATLAVALFALGACGGLDPTAVPKPASTPVLSPPVRLASPSGKEPAPLALYLEGDSVKVLSGGWVYQDWILSVWFDQSESLNRTSDVIQLWGHIETLEGVSYAVGFDDWCPDPDLDNRSECSKRKQRPYPASDRNRSPLGYYRPFMLASAPLRIAKRIHITTRVAEAATPTRLVVDTNFGPFTYAAPFDTDVRGFLGSSEFVRNPESYANLWSALDISSSPSMTIAFGRFCNWAVQYSATNNDRLREGNLTLRGELYAVNFLEAPNWAVAYRKFYDGPFVVGPGQTVTATLRFEASRAYQTGGAGDFDPLYLAVAPGGKGTVRWFELPPRNERCIAK